MKGDGALSKSKLLRVFLPSHCTDDDAHIFVRLQLQKKGKETSEQNTKPGERVKQEMLGTLGADCKLIPLVHFSFMHAVPQLKATQH